MARGTNLAILIGNVGGDVDSRTTPSGTTIATLSLATTDSWRDKQTGEKQEKTEWHRVKFFGKLAEIVAQYVTKGRQIYVQGSLRTDKYTDKQGVERYSTYVVGNDMQMLGANPERAAGGQAGGYAQSPRGAGQQHGNYQSQQPSQRGNGYPPRGQAQQPQPQQAPQEPAYAGGGGGFDGDDIPFAQYQRGMYV